MRSTSASLTVGSMRELSAIGTVCGLGTGYATAILGAAGILGAYGSEQGGSPGVLLATVAAVFIMIALFVSSVVISNGVDTVIAGRRAQLALLRLVGASGAQLRSSLVRAVAGVAAVGSVVGVGVATVGLFVVRSILVGNGTLPEGDYPLMSSLVPFAAVAMVATAVGATYVGAHRTLTSMTVSRSPRVRRSVARPIFAVLTISLGAVILGGAVWLGERASLAGFGVAFLGAATVSVGVLFGARSVVPWLVAGFGRLLGRGPAAIVARRNAVSDPLRTTRSTLGLLIGVTLVTTIAAGMASLQTATETWEGLSPEDAAEVAQVMSVTSAVLIAMVAVSAVIAAVGFVSTMSLTVIGRTREIGMLRAMGFTGRQVRSMVTLESIALSGTAVVVGLVLGMAFGAVGSQSLVGSVTTGIPVVLPLPALVGIVGGALLLVAAASVPPGRRAAAMSPVDALAVA
ncbi:hypothetical protein GCM10009624_23750 [Gordonia sinesedis]